MMGGAWRDNRDVEVRQSFQGVVTAVSWMLETHGPRSRYAARLLLVIHLVANLVELRGARRSVSERGGKVVTPDSRNFVGRHKNRKMKAESKISF